MALDWTLGMTFDITFDIVLDIVLDTTIAAGIVATERKTPGFRRASSFERNADARVASIRTRRNNRRRP